MGKNTGLFSVGAKNKAGSTAIDFYFKLEHMNSTP